MHTHCHTSYLEVDLNALRGNIAAVQQHLRGRCGMIPVVKANAYGMGIERVTRLLHDEYGFGLVGVAQAYEGLLLRESGLGCGALVMGGTPLPAVADAVRAGLELTVFLPETVEEVARAAREAGVRARVHIKIETGMNRIGARPGDALDALLREIKRHDSIHVVGVFTHFATSDKYNDENTLAQYERFKQGVRQVRDAGFDPEYVHCCNSGATVWLDEAFDFCTHVRPGSLYLGYDMMSDGSNPLKVREAMSWRATITNIHEVLPGEGVGYGQHFKPQKPTLVATVGIGYGDGLYRPMAQTGGPVLLNDTRSRYLATCMDQCFVDATGIPCRVGDEITVVGHSRGGAFISAFEIERFTGQCYQNALCSINNRVARVYLG